MRITERYTDYTKEDELAITAARYIGDFAIRLTFSDGKQQLVDFKPFLEQSQHPAIKKYLQEERFKTFTLQNGNLDWNDFDLYFSLENLYRNEHLPSGANSTKNRQILGS